MAIKHTFKEHVLRIVAVIGLIAVLLLGAWGIIQLAFFIPTFLSNLAGGTTTTETSKESLTVTLPASITAAQAFPVSWSHKNAKGAYSYTLSYSCQDGLSAKAPLPNGTAQVVACNTPFNYINATNTTPLIFTLAGTKSVPVAIKVSATKLDSGSVTSTGTANTTVTPSAALAPATPVKTPAKKPATTKPGSTKYVASGRTTNLYGSSDLQVRILSNPGTVRAGAQVSLQFAIENVGTNVTPSNWTFTASLPYSPVYTFQSQGQQALYPGDKIIYTLGYAATPVTGYNSMDIGSTYGMPYNPNGSTMGDPYGYGYVQSQYPAYGQNSTASVTVDPYNQVWEMNETNNYAAISYQVY